MPERNPEKNKESERPTQSDDQKKLLLSLVAVCFLALIGVALAAPAILQNSKAPAPAPAPLADQSEETVDPLLSDLLADTGATIEESMENADEEEFDCVDEALVWNPHSGSQEIGQRFSRYGASHRAEEIFTEMNANPTEVDGAGKGKIVRSKKKATVAPRPKPRTRARRG